MKIFHTADWHLGKLVNGVYMTEDQRHIFEEFYQHIEKEKPDVIIVAGDLYDRSLPPAEAVTLLNDIFEKIILDYKVPVLAISGNHDSPYRLDFGSKIMKENGLHIVGELKYPFTNVTLEDEFGEVVFHFIPYAEPGQVRHTLENEDIHSHDDAMKIIIDTIKEDWNTSARHIAIGHAFVTVRGEEEDNTSDAERPLSIGGADYVNHTYFKDFHYTALGHLHQAHKVGDENIRYAGSPLKYSVSERDHKKGFYVIDLDSNGVSNIEKVLLKPIKDIRLISGTLDDILQMEKSNDYMYIRLEEDIPVLQPMEKIRTVFPNVMNIERIVKQIEKETRPTQNRHEMDELSLFQAFYKEIKGEVLDKEREQIFIDVLEEIKVGERE